jgi:hypothetical protein
VLLTQDFSAKLSDFGLSRMLSEGDTSAVTKAEEGPLKWLVSVYNIIDSLTSCDRHQKH